MIEIKITRVDYRNNNTPILYDREIDEYAHAVLEDYRPELLREPGKISFEHFLEYYLHVTLLFKDIYSEDENKRIFGAVVFHGGILKVRDSENDSISNKVVRANTIVIDNYVMEPGRNGLALFTGLHESGHFLIHQGVYAVENKNRENKIPSVVYCRRETIENFGAKSTAERTAKQWREHHADYFAASLSMPNATFIPFVHSFLREHGVFKKGIVLGRDDDLDILGKDLLPERISEVYGVSKRAALIKLHKSGFVIK
jgi:Zn-dependent peptidase ImmA (M78 family)